MAIEKEGEEVKRASVRCKGGFRLRARGSEAFRHRSGALRKETGFCDKFETHLIELFCCSMLFWLSLLRGGLPGSSRLCFFVANDVRGPLFLRIRKRFFLHVVCKTSFPVLEDYTPVNRLRVCLIMCYVFQSGG